MEEALATTTVYFVIDEILENVPGEQSADDIHPRNCRSANRNYQSPGNLSDNVGFRVVAVLA
jgi:formylglycine-generating enzyme required for sulfatase activity